jgi:hypothetical protein
LSTTIAGFARLLPLLHLLAKPGVLMRHWQIINQITGSSLQVWDRECKLSDVLALPLALKFNEVQAVAEGATAELAIAAQLALIQEQCAALSFTLTAWRGR